MKRVLLLVAMITTCLAASAAAAEWTEQGKLMRFADIHMDKIVFTFEGDLWLAIHLMIAGRLRWKKPGATLARKVGLAAFASIGCFTSSR